MADPGFTGRPGLDQELFDTATVFAKWCNDAGGINGRKIVVNQRDAALFNVKARMTEACAGDFMLVGGGVVFDQDGVTTRLGCLMPEIAGYAVSPQQRGSDLLIQPLPNDTKTLPIGDYKYLAKKYPERDQGLRRPHRRRRHHQDRGAAGRRGRAVARLEEGLRRRLPGHRARATGRRTRRSSRTTAPRA